MGYDVCGDTEICRESREQVEESLERRGIKVSRNKTEYMCMNESKDNGKVRMRGVEVAKVDEFKYLGPIVMEKAEER